MINSKRIFKELKELSLETKHPLEKVVGIGVRFASREVEKIEVFIKELKSVLFAIIDGKHQAYRKNDEIQSIFICENTGYTLYDSRNYTPEKDKIKLQKDNYRGLAAFRNMSDEEKGQIVEVLASKFSGADITINPSKQTNWGGDLPWDFSKKQK